MSPPPPTHTHTHHHRRRTHNRPMGRPPLRHRLPQHTPFPHRHAVVWRRAQWRATVHQRGALRPDVVTRHGAPAVGWRAHQRRAKVVRRRSSGRAAPTWLPRRADEQHVPPPPPQTLGIAPDGAVTTANTLDTDHTTITGHPTRAIAADANTAACTRLGTDTVASTHRPAPLPMPLDNTTTTRNHPEQRHKFLFCTAARSGHPRV